MMELRGEWMDHPITGDRGVFIDMETIENLSFNVLPVYAARMREDMKVVKEELPNQPLLHQVFQDQLNECQEFTYFLQEDEDALVGT